VKGYIRSSGHWAIVLDERDSGTGRWRSFTGTKRQANVPSRSQS
jgi:hypothetical protein